MHKTEGPIDQAIHYESHSRSIAGDSSNNQQSTQKSLSKDLEHFCRFYDSNIEFPQKSPSVPQSSPVDGKNNVANSKINQNLPAVCIRKLPLILLPPERNVDIFRERSRSQSDADCRFLLNDRPLQTEEHFRRKSSIQCPTDSELEVVFERDSRFETKSFSYIFPNPEGHCNLSIGSAAEMNDNRFLRALSDADSVVANCASDVSDISSDHLSL
ncbi:hypothetical protein CDAR_65561 [Caerostris darwini]|uniref:Uncharacterized protein n=1 Tax=Caerostris darwini TaxID=1538125 RepID=A0AAV4SCP5_9ARAC|nr:hypothetical protein CDAR_65561 [Caerostris darwini]